MPMHNGSSNDDHQPPIQPIVIQQQNETVFLLDWDDTLICSSFLQANGFKLDTEVYDLNRPLKDGDSAYVREQYEIALQLRELETCVVNFLRLAIGASRCVICTNAESGWVQLSASKFLPNVLPLLQHVTVVSARSSFEHLFPNAPLKWKFFQMHELLIGSGFFGRDGRAHVTKHVISLGDSLVEREAVRAVCAGVPSTLIKTVKFAEQPTIEQLRRQLELVIQCFDYIHSHPQNLDLMLTVTPNPNAPNLSQPTIATPQVATPPPAHVDAPINLTAEEKPIPMSIQVDSSLVDEPTGETDVATPLISTSMMIEA